MISDVAIINLITTKTRGGQVVYHNDQDRKQYTVDDNHEWDFKNNTYVVVKRFTTITKK